MGQATAKRRATTKAPQPVVGVASVLKAMKKGATLHLTHSRGPRGGSAQNLFRLEPQGVPVRERDAKETIASGRLQPFDLGLFAGVPQSWKLRPPETREAALERWSGEIPAFEEGEVPASK